MKNCFITLEGPDGSGKTTIALLLKDELTNLGYEVVHTREPGGVKIAEDIRNIILDVNNQVMDYKTEALLYAASRRQHLVEKVLPALKEGKIVLCERFIDSSLAYQGVARNIGFEEILKLNEFAIEGFFPNLTIFLELDEKIGLERIHENRVFKDRLDSEKESFHNLVNQGYKQVKETFKDRIKLVDASLSIDEVKEDCLALILEYLNA